MHLLHAADLPIWTGALSALPSSVPSHPEGVRFTAAQANEVTAAIGDALADAELTTGELTVAIADRIDPWAVERTMDALRAGSTRMAAYRRRAQTWALCAPGFRAGETGHRLRG